MSRARRSGALAGAAAVMLFGSSAAAVECPAGAGDCAPLSTSGSLGASIDLVIVGDGYTQAERSKFYADAQVVASGLFGSETYAAYESVFNTWALFTASNESGADEPEAGTSVDTAYDATFGTGAYYYLLTVNAAVVHADVNKRFPESDLVLCIVNSTDYGGSGGSVAVISLNEMSIDIGRHELGHVIAGLADEYTQAYPGYPDGDPEPNVAAANHLDPPKWEQWLTPGVAIPTPIDAATGDHEPIGAYEGARYKETGVFRPAPGCIMRDLNVGFCPVCSEAMVLEISKMSLLIDAPIPESPATIPAEGATTFTATIPALSDLAFAWTIDGQPATGSEKSLAVEPSALGLADGPHEVTLTVIDATPFVRNDPTGAMTEAFTWSVTVDSKLPPATGSGGGGDGGGGASGGNGGTGGANDPGDCGCRIAGRETDVPMTWLLLGLAPLAHGLRRRARRS